jgi:hypothetical protein
MVLTSELAGMFLHYFTPRIGNNEVYMKQVMSSPFYYLEVLDYTFQVKTQGKNLEFIVSPPTGTEAIFERHFTEIVKREFESNPIVPGERKSRMYKGHLIVQDFQKVGKGDYLIKARFATNHKGKAFNSLLKTIVLPVLSVPRKE